MGDNCKCRQGLGSPTQGGGRGLGELKSFQREHAMCCSAVVEQASAWNPSKELFPSQDPAKTVVSAFASLHCVPHFLSPHYSLCSLLSNANNGSGSVQCEVQCTASKRTSQKSAEVSWRRERRGRGGKDGRGRGGQWVRASLFWAAALVKTLGAAIVIGSETSFHKGKLEGCKIQICVFPVFKKLTQIRWGSSSF